MSLISVFDLTFAYDGSYDNVFENVSFQIDTDWRLGFIGRNGRGKTTFLKLLSGELTSGGSISASVDFSYFPYDVKDKSVDTIDVVAKIYSEYELWQLLRELSLLEVDKDVLNRRFDTLSEGEKTKVLLAVMFMRENNFLLIDEPTNHLDMKGREIVSRYLSGKKGFILVSHDRAFLDGCIDHVLSINRMNIEVQKGNFSSWLENKRRLDAFEMAENEKLQREIGRLKDTIAQKTAWSDRAERKKVGIDPNEVDSKKGHRALWGAKSKKLMSRAKAIEQRREKAIQEKSKLLLNIDHNEELKIAQLEYHRKRLISLSNVRIVYDDEPVNEAVTFTIEQGDRIAIFGKNGSGKSSIIKLICSEGIPYDGEIIRGSSIKISYVPQDTSMLSGSLAEFAAKSGVDETLFKTILRKLDFERIQFDKDMRHFSAGQRKKVLIARSLSEKAHLHVWDEPMNYIDVISRMQIEALLLKFRPTILFVEHDKAFCDMIATKFIRL